MFKINLKRLGIIYFLIFIVFFISCNDDEKLVDNTKEVWRMLIARDNENPRIEMIEFPSAKVISNDIVKENNNFNLTSLPSKIKIYRNMIYLLIPAEYKILIFKLSDFKLAYEISFADEKLEPTDICFLPNGTTAYVCHKNSNLITILDIYFFKKARQIEVGNNPSAIACSGNQVYVANYGDHSVSIIDSRTNTEEAVIKLSPKPIYIGFDYTGKTAIVVSIGFGKDGEQIEKTPAVATFIDVEQRIIEGSLELGYQVHKSIDQIPAGLGISETNWAFIATNEMLVRIDLKRKDRVIFINRFKYSDALYNYYKKEIWLLRDDGNEYSLIIANQTTGVIIQRFQLGKEIQAVHPL